MFESGIFLQLDEKLQLAWKAEKQENCNHKGSNCNNGKESDEYDKIFNVEHLNDNELPYEAFMNTVYPQKGQAAD